MSHCPNGGSQNRRHAGFTKDIGSSGVWQALPRSFIRIKLYIKYLEALESYLKSSKDYSLR